MPRQSVKEDVKSIVRMGRSKRMRRLLPQQLWTGISIAYYSSCLVPMITDTISEDKLERSIIAMCIFGIGQVFGGLLVGQIIDRRGSRYVAIVNVLLVLIMLFVTLAFLGINKFNLLAFLMTFMWGLQDASINTHSYEILGFEFDNNSEPYSIFNLAQALGVVVFQLIEAALDSNTKYLVYTAGVGAIGVYSCGLTFFFQFRDQMS